MTSKTFSTGKIISGKNTQNLHDMTGSEVRGHTSSNTQFLLQLHSPTQSIITHTQCSLVKWKVTCTEKSHGRSHDSFFILLFFFTNTAHLSTQPHDHMAPQDGFCFQLYRSHVYTAKVTCMHSHIT
jgi:hypothetical protein